MIIVTIISQTCLTSIAQQLYTKHTSHYPISMNHHPPLVYHQQKKKRLPSLVLKSYNTLSKHAHSNVQKTTFSHAHTIVSIIPSHNKIPLL